MMSISRRQARWLSGRGGSGQHGTAVTPSSFKYITAICKKGTECG